MRDHDSVGRSPAGPTPDVCAIPHLTWGTPGRAPAVAALTVVTLTVLALAACPGSDDADGPDLTKDCGTVTAVHPLPGKGSISVEMQNPQPDVSYILEIQDPATLNVVGQAGPNGNPVVFTGMPSGTFPAIWLVSGCDKSTDTDSDQLQIPGPIDVTVP